MGQKYVLMMPKATSCLVEHRYQTDEEERIIISYKADVTACNGLKKGTIQGKRMIDDQMSDRLTQLL